MTHPLLHMVFSDKARLQLAGHSSSGMTKASSTGNYFGG